MATVRTAEAHWEGSLFEGQGDVELVSSGIGKFETSWSARAEQPNGKTSPEELIAAAHSTCFSMALAGHLTHGGNPPTSLDTRADVSFDPSEHHRHQADRYRGGARLTAEQFEAAAQDAKENCPVSKAITGTTITLEAIARKVLSRLEQISHSWRHRKLAHRSRPG